MKHCVPPHLKIYHIVHMDKLPSIIQDGCLWCDAEIMKRRIGGTTIGMDDIKERRLYELTLSSHPDLHVGDCVPFYFCPRSVMLYINYKANHADIRYKGGQDNIVHLEGDLIRSVEWANDHRKRWAFSLSNAGSHYFEDRSSLKDLHQINWEMVAAEDWRQCKEEKQAEFLMEHDFPWHLIERIGVLAPSVAAAVQRMLSRTAHPPRLEIKPEWYY